MIAAAEIELSLARDPNLRFRHRLDADPAGSTNASSRRPALGPAGCR
jgi:hypothetical protein